MTRTVLIISGIGLLAAVAWIVMAASGHQVMPSYLAGWLFCLSLPLGALPLLMLFELAGAADWPITLPLRRFLLLQPVAALFAIPVLLGQHALYGRPATQNLPPAGWMGPGFFTGRTIIMLLIWTGLSLVFARPPRRRPRGGLAALGLCLHLAIGTLAALDWVMSIDPGLDSSAFGLVAMSSQVSTALCAAVFVLALGSGNQLMPADAAPLLLVALGSWMFLHFAQFVVVWSGDMPTEITWYQHRTGGLGETELWFAFAAAVLAVLVLLPDKLARLPFLLASVAAMLLLVHLTEMLWLVTPSFRDRFTLTWPDLLAMLGLVGLAAGFLLRVRPAAAKDVVRHEGA
jgi:hypothetical protein